MRLKHSYLLLEALKSMGSISYFSKIHGFHGTHGTHANYAPEEWLEISNKNYENFKVSNYMVETCNKLV